MQYKHVVITRHGGAEVLQLVQDELPEPKPDEVRVKVLTSGVAFTDVLVREGLYPGTPKPPFSPGYAVVGMVDRLGAEVTTLEVGQRVAALTIVGGYSEFLCLPAAELVPVPAGADAPEAVSLVLQYLTAYQLLHRVAGVKPGDRILIHGAGGGVGTALLELGRLAQLELYGTDWTTKHDLIVRLGGMPFDPADANFVELVRARTGGGVEVVFDGIGGTHLLQSARLLRPGGRLVSYGFSSALRAKRTRLLQVGMSFLLLSWLKVWPNGHSAAFYSIADVKRQHPDWFRADLTRLLELLASGKIKPIIADCFPLEEAARAHELLDQAAVHGQLVLLCNPDA